MATFPTSIRRLREDDRGFVIGHWLTSYWSDAVPRRKGKGGDVPRCDWKVPVKARVRVLLDEDVTLVACDPEEDARLFGFVCGGPAALHYVFVRPTRRRAGLGSELLDAIARERGAPYDRRSTTYVTRDWLAFRDAGRAAA